ncbi:MAG TPA: T9SS type A sorting domain-containing protein [Bacteroidia bacterium]|jgi:hypothetical protein|nr:T9SS type A sorting domain-containing protein [Bacteroidia bacterium]
MKGFFSFCLLLFSLTLANKSAASTLSVTSGTVTISAAAFAGYSTISISVGAQLIVTGTVSLGGNTSIDVADDGDLVINGDFNVGGNSSFTLSGAGTMEINGNVSASGHFSLDDNGGLAVSGNASFSGSAAVSGTGSLAVAGTTSTSGSGTVFGGTGSCTGCTMGNGDPLPISLLSFDAIATEKTVDLKWTTVTQTNNSYFTIEKSKDGQNFAEVARVQGAGTSTQELTYSTIDDMPSEGVSYYRLKQTDFNGKYTVFKIVPVTFNLKPVVRVYPNPANDNFSIETNDITTQSMQVFDVAGKVVLSQQISNKAHIDVSALDEGIYTLTLSNDYAVVNKKIVIIRQ